MPTMHARYGRPKGSGVDDSLQLKNLAALLVANPALKPTTAIRSLGVEDPSVIRRLRDKFRMDQARLMSDARRSFRSTGCAHGRPGPVHARRPLTSLRNPISAAPIVLPDEAIVVEPAHTAPQPPLLAICCDLGLWAAATAIERQSVLTRHWLQHPAIEIALRGQLAVGAFVVAAMTPRKPLKPRLH